MTTKTKSTSKEKPVTAKKAASKIAKVKAAVESPPVTKPATKKAAVKKTAKKITKVNGATVLALVDVGFGKQLFLRGSGCGLSWETGTLMTCLPQGDSWVIMLENVTAPVVAKFLINDTTWASGEDVLILPGENNTFTPSF